MKIKTFLIFALLCMVAQGAWADSAFGGGDGSAKNPYIISTTDHWNQFASNVNGGTTYSGMYFQLGANITVSTMVGAGTKSKDAKPFSGTFDGGGHTLTFNHTATEAEGDVAPFRFVRSATICNLHVAGEINTAYRHAAGLSARAYGTTLIKNCRVSTVINSSVSGDATHGGIVVMKPDYSSANLTIEGCVFDGKILTTNGSTHCGGLVGYTSYGSLTIKNSIYAPAKTAEGETAVSSEHTFYRYSDSHPGNITLDKCYYTQTLGNPQGRQALSIAFPEGVDIDIVPKGEATEYNVSGITIYEGNPSVKYNGTVYAGSSDVVELTFINNYVGCNVTGYNVAEGDAKLTENITGDYTLKMGSENVVIGFSMTGPPLFQLGGEGKENSPYLISDSGTWDYIVSLVNYRDQNGNAVYSAYASAYYKLTADIEVTTMMGSESNRFSGHFDGGIYDEDGNLTGYHTLTVNYDTDEQYTAPFRYTNGAEISNLRVAGTIKTSKKFAAGFVANAQGTNTMKNCRSSVTINSSVSGDGSHGGFVAHNLSGYFIMEGCTFDGYLLGSSTNNCGGFVGWNETAGAVDFLYCFFIPTSITVDLEHTYARSRSYDSDHVKVRSSYCRTNIGDGQQYRVYSISAGDGVTVAANETVSATYTVSGITKYSTGMMFDGMLYAQNGRSMSLNLGYTGAGTPTGFTTTSGTLSGDSNPFTLTMGTGDAVINAITGGSGSAWSGSGSGTSESPYIISTTAQWNELANKVNNAVFGFNTAYYKLADGIDGITVTTMVGTEDHRFKGHFDGNDKTLTVSYGTAESPFSEDYCAPFRYIENAEVSNLRVTGTIYTGKMFAAGLAGFALNDNTITNCRSSVTINSSVNGDGTHGGFVANCQNNINGNSTVTFTNCAFDGSLIGASTDNWGGFVGWTEGKDWASVKTVGCLFAPAGLNVDSDGSATFSRGRDNNWSHVTIEDSYYTQSFGTIQGNMAYTTPPVHVTSEAKTIAGITVYVRNTVVTDVTATDITPTTATISWKGTNACSNYQVRYREKKNSDIYSTSFEDGMPDGWTTFDNDDDNDRSWTYENGTKKGMTHSGSGCMYSASYINNYGSLEPDNWLVTTQLDLSGTLKVWLKGQDGDDYREHFAIYLSTTGNSKDDFLDAGGNLQSGVVTLVPETETTSEYQEYIADLSAYSGQKGYIAIRHFNCYGQFYLVLDDFLIYDDNLSGEWATVPGASASGDGETCTITGLTPATTYEYQVAYDYSSNTYYTPTMILTTLADDVAPTDLSATDITANTATIGWKGFGDSYNLRYCKGGVAKVTLYVPNDVWGDGSGYQMLLDADHDTYGYNSTIPTTGGMSGDATELASKYDEFEYKIPDDADCALNTTHMLNGTEGKQIATITIPAGTYDWCITNPTPDDRMWIAAGNGNVGGRQDDFVFDAGKHYTFTVTFDDNEGQDRVDMTVEDDATLVTGDEKEVTGIVAAEANSSSVAGDCQSPTYTLSGLDADTYYTVYVQSVKGDKVSDWSSVNFTTTDATSIGLIDNGDNTAVIAANSDEQRNVTLVGRTLYKDGDWNTLCLPFSVTLADSPLDGATVMELDVTGTYDAEGNASVDGGFATGFSDGTLYLYFKPATSIEAGKPYLIKWTDDDDIVNPTFSGVTVNSDAPEAIKSTDGKVNFLGNYAPEGFAANDKSVLYLGAENNLYYPSKDMTINAFRAYFQLNGITASDMTNGARLFFGDEETTGIISIDNGKWIMDNGAEANSSLFTLHSSLSSWYDLQGRKVNGQRSMFNVQRSMLKKGVYIHNGKKVVIK